MWRSWRTKGARADGIIWICCQKKKKRPDRRIGFVAPACLSPSASLSPHRSLLHPPSLPPSSLSLHPPAPSPHNPYLDRSHVCCDASWLTAHLHVCSSTSLLKGCVAVERMEMERGWGWRDMCSGESLCSVTSWVDTLWINWGKLGNLMYKKTSRVTFKHICIFNIALQYVCGLWVARSYSQN